MNLKLVIDAAAYVAIRTAIAVVQALPLAACERIASSLAVVLYDLVRLRRRVIDENLAYAFPDKSEAELQQIARDMWRHLMLMVAEIAHTPRKLHQTNWRQHASIPQIGPLVRLLLDGRPHVVLSAHYGNFELAGYLLALFGFPSHSIARPLDNPYLDRFVNRFRGRTGQRMLPKDGSGDQIARVLAAGGIVALLGDQSAGPKGCWVDFFGRPASTHKAVAVLALGADAPLLVSYARRLDRPLQYELGLEGAVDPVEPDGVQADVPGLIQWYTECLEQIIRRAPEQYWWIHRRWKGAPPANRRPQAA